MIIRNNLKQSWTKLFVPALALVFFLSSVSIAFAAPPAAPVIITATQSTSTNPIILTGTADANMSIQITGGVSTTTASSTAGGTWAISVDLSANAVNHLSVVAFNTGGEFSSTSTVDITHDDTGPAAPVISTPSICSTTSPVTMNGTAEANSTIDITGGSSATSTTASGSGDWSASVGLNPNTSTTISVTATDSLGNVSGTSTLSAIFDTTAPVVTVNGDSRESVFVGRTFTDSGVSVTDNLDASTTASTTGSVNSNVAGTYTLTYTATDCAGNVATTTRTVLVIEARGGGGGGGGRSSSSPNPSPVAIAQVAANIPFPAQISNPVFALSQGQVLGISTFRFPRGLARGMRGEDVAQLQILLKELGLFKVNATGYFGNITAAALRAFQRGLGLRATGQLDAETITVLNNS